MPLIALEKLTELVARALKRAGASKTMAQSTAQALVAAEAEGLGGHGLSRVALYCQHLREGRANGKAKPRIIKRKGATALIDAGGGLAFPACALAVKEAITRAKKSGVSFVGVTNSHHMGAVAYHLAPIAQAGMVGLAFTISPSAINAWGGKRAFYGTNPVAAVFPRRNEPPLMIDLSLSEVARGKLMVAAKEGKPIPLGWALDSQGKPTTDPKAGLAGSMLPLGSISSSKGSMLALIVELLVTAVIGARFGFEASSFFVDEGNAPRIGQAFVVIDPGALAGSEVYYERMETLISEMLSDDGVRLAGVRRMDLEEKAQHAGLVIPDALKSQLDMLAAQTS